MKNRPVRQGHTTLETTCPTPSDKCVSSLTTPSNLVTLKMRETGLTVISKFSAPTIEFLAF